MTPPSRIRARDGEVPAKRKRRPDPLRCLSRKECGFCGQSLRQAARGHCGGIYAETREGCWWVPTIRDFGPAEALKRSRGNVRDGARDGEA